MKCAYVVIRRTGGSGGKGGLAPGDLVPVTWSDEQIRANKSLGRIQTCLIVEPGDDMEDFCARFKVVDDLRKVFLDRKGPNRGMFLTPLEQAIKRKRQGRSILDHLPLAPDDAPGPDGVEPEVSTGEQSGGEVSEGEGSGVEEPVKTAPEEPEHATKALAKKAAMDKEVAKSKKAAARKAAAAKKAAARKAAAAKKAEAKKAAAAASNTEKPTTTPE